MKNFEKLDLCKIKVRNCYKKLQYFMYIFCVHNQNNKSINGKQTNTQQKKKTIPNLDFKKINLSKKTIGIHKNPLLMWR